MARPTKWTPEIEKKLIEVFHIDGTVDEACSQAGIWTTTYYDWKKADKEFAYRMHAAQKYPFIVARKTLFNAAKWGSEKSAIEILKRRDKRYSEKVDQTQDINLYTKTVYLPPLMDDEWDSTKTKPLTSDQCSN